jgi:formate dehydrogenase major subunit
MLSSQPPALLHGERWEEALQLVANRLSEIKAAHGPDAIGLVASSKCTNEEAYLMQKLGRQVVGTNNIDNCSRYCHYCSSCTT